VSILLYFIFLNAKWVRDIAAAAFHLRSRSPARAGPHNFFKIYYKKEECTLIHFLKGAARFQKINQMRLK
jgi:hypothetical protein